MIRKLKKIKNYSLPELETRTRQAASVLAERIGISKLARLPSDSFLFQSFGCLGSNASADALLEYFINRDATVFYQSFADPESTIATLQNRYPPYSEYVLTRAERIRQGYFDLLGHKNLHFGGEIPDWHFDPVLQKESPKIHWSSISEVDPAETGDKKIIWELNRHQYFSVLGQAYWLTKDERYAETLMAHLESWFESNPPKMGVNWLSSLEVSFRSISWIWAFYFFKDSPKFNPDIFLRMLKYFYVSGRHIENYISTYFSPNTHLTGEALGLYLLGTFLPEMPESRRWKELGYGILMDALDFQIRPDGVYCEQSSHYQRYTVDFYANLLILRRLEGAGIHPKHHAKLNQLLDFLLYITQPNGETPLFGDDDGGRLYFLDDTAPTDFRPTLALGAALLDRGDLKFAAGEPGPELLWLLGTEGVQKFDSLSASEPGETVRGFRSGGFFTARTNWTKNADYIFIDCGPHGFLNCGHAHADALNFILSVDGQPIFIDSGTFNYTSDPDARNYFRSSSAHNCLTVRGKSSSAPAGPFSWESTANSKVVEYENCGSLLLRGTHDGFEHLGVYYEREFLFTRDRGIAVTESIKAGDQIDLSLHFILSPVVSAEPGDDSVRIMNQAGETLLVISTEIVGGDISVPGRWHKEECCVSPLYGARAAAEKIIFSIRAAGELQIRNRFVKPGTQMSPTLQPMAACL